MPNRQSARTGSELFIVDNSDDDWKAEKYLRDWCGLSRSFDVATGYWEIGSLLALEGEWQKLDHIRILMGDEVSRRTKSAFEGALRARVAMLDSSVEVEKEKDDFLDGVPAIVDALRHKKIEARLYRKAKFHAKAYITHARQEVVGSAALVGSSNFTRPGLTQNIELNVQITGQPVSVLQEWYDDHWDQAEDVTLDLLRTVERHVQEFTPFDVYARSLREYFSHKELTAGEWETTRSRIWPLLDGYQKEGYGALRKIASLYEGAFLCDGVGLGKTFVGLMVLERLVEHERKKVCLLVPKSSRDSVWVANLRKYLPHLAEGVFSNLFIMNHTDLSRDSMAEQIAQIGAQADAIIIDEAHNFRNPGVAGKGERRESRYRTLQRMAAGKEMYLLTATPVNNSILDLMHLMELFSGSGEKLKRAGIHSLQGHFRSLEKKIRQASGEEPAGDQGDLFSVDEDVSTGAAHQVFEDDPLVNELVIQRQYERDWVELICANDFFHPNTPANGADPGFQQLDDIATSDGLRPRMPRIEVSCVGFVREEAILHRALLHNISQGGVSVEPANPLTVGADVTVSLPGLAPQGGVVSWNDGSRYGIRFNSVIPLAGLVEWLHSRQGA